MKQPMTSTNNLNAPTGVSCIPLLGRDYTTRSSAHGSGYVPLATPETFNMTLDEAEADVRFWRNYADTVGGDAIIVKRPNGRDHL